MNSRPNNISGERLRRVKSASSANASSSTKRHAIAIDPFVVRQTAETAATEAYRRAQPVEQSSYPGYRPVPPKLQRRKSQATGRSEGSHLEDARLGRRRSTVRREDSSSARPTDPRPRQSAPPIVHHSHDGEVVVTRKRSVIPPSASATRPAGQERLSLPTTDRHYRKTASTFQTGSPAPRSTPAFKEGHLSAPLPTSRYTERSYDEGISIRYKEPRSYADRYDGTQVSATPKASPRETQTDEEIVALARDRYLQDFQQKKLRERKSFFGSIQKLQKRGSSAVPVAAVGYDTSVPPFNYAEEATIGSIPTPTNFEPPLVSSEDTVKGNRKPRVFSGSMKGRLKKLLRKTSRVSSTLPAQYIEAKHPHYSLAEDSESPVHPSQSTSDPFLEPQRSATASDFVSPSINGENADSKTSLGDSSSAGRSRVTSWANSTVAGTMTTAADRQSCSQADEHGRLQRSGSMSTLRKKGSFFGRSIQDRLRKTSRAELKGSDESQALYTALQERLQSPPQCPITLTQEEDGSPHDHPLKVSSLSDLPSQSRSTSSTTSLSHRRSSTIRKVSPDANPYCVPMMSPVVEASPDRVPQETEDPEATPVGSRGTKHVRERTTTTMQAAPLSQQQIARRVQRTRDRWQGPLDALSPPLEHRKATIYGEDNPYELPSRHQRTHAETEVDTGGLPQHAKISSKPHPGREALLSPSLYSRATDGASPRPETPEEGGMMITITSREVKRYSLSPPKKTDQPTQRPVQGSCEWRKWLSDEMHGFVEPGDPENLALANDKVDAAAADVTDDSITQDYAVLEDSALYAEPRPASPRLVEESKPQRPQRPRASSRRSSSYMNERYPIVESSRNSSRQSASNSRKVSFAGADGTRSRNLSMTDDRKHPIPESQAHAIAPTEAPRRVSKRHSLAQMVMGSRSKPTHDQVASGSTPSATDNPQSHEPAPPIPPKAAARPTTKAKSAFDLRANYKNSRTSVNSRPLEVRRKTTATPLTGNLLDDNTLRNISAGPYAPSPSPVCHPSTANKENTPSLVAAEDNGLPAVSSSEWLAGPTVGKKRGSGQGHIRCSPGKTGVLSESMGGNRSGREGSPGQRLVTGWLEGRMRDSQEPSPAFI